MENNDYKEAYEKYCDLGGALTYDAWLNLYVTKPPTYLDKSATSTRMGYNLYATGHDKFEFTYVPEYIPAELQCRCGNDTFTDTDDDVKKLRGIVCKECGRKLIMEDMPKIKEYTYDHAK